MTRDIGQFTQDVASWRKLMAAMTDDEGRWRVFENAACGLAAYVAQGHDRIEAVDQLQEIATAYGLGDPDAVQQIIADAFRNADEPMRTLLDDDAPPPATNGHNKHARVKEAPPPPQPLTFINIALWSGKEPRGRRWAVPDRIPAANVTLLTGEGGVGKTLLMQQLSVATVIARDWIGSLPEPGPVIFITAEDDEDELHFRYHKIAQHYGVDFRDLSGLHLMSLAGRDAVMAAVNNKGIVQPTELFERLKRSAAEIRPRWIGIDTAADVFIVDERSRSEVRQCISLLRGLALTVDTAMILLAHPSLTGINSGSGLSGSTAWNNSVRSRLYLKSPKKKDKDDEDDDESPVRILEMMKANYSAIAEPVRLTWKDGLLLNEAGPAPMQRVSQETNAQIVFLALIDRHNKQDIPVSANPYARNFAPKVFAGLSESKPLATRNKIRKDLLHQAMEYLLSKDRLYVGRGPKGVAPSKQSPCLYSGGVLL
jgi:RecA-family ATPase